MHTFASPTEALLAEGHLPAASQLPVELPRRFIQETKWRLSLTREHYPAGGKGPHLSEAAEAASTYKDPFSCTPSPPPREDNKREINGPTSALGEPVSESCLLRLTQPVKSLLQSSVFRGWVAVS